MPFVLGIEMPFFGIEMPRTLCRLPERVATIAPARPASAAPEASRGTFAFRANGMTRVAPLFTESATPFDAGAAFPLALDDPLEPFDFGLEDRDPRELEAERFALDFVFVWATVGLPFSPGQPRSCRLPESPCYPMLDEIINRNARLRQCGQVVLPELAQARLRVESRPVPPLARLPRLLTALASGGALLAQSLRTTLIAPSSFFWNIS